MRDLFSSRSLLTSIPQKGILARIIIDEGKAQDGVCLGNMLEIRFLCEKALWKLCQIVLEVKLRLADRRCRMQALQESVILAALRGEPTQRA